MRTPRLLLSLGLLLSLVLPVRADEGMWTYHDFPTQILKDAHGFTAGQEWLDHLRLSSVRLARGCSGSLVSAEGLVMTNHHCAVGCLERLSTAEENLVDDGFYARTHADERQCPEMEINVLVETTDVTERVRGATAGKEGAAFADARRAVIADIEGACTTGEGVRCDVVTLYHGGQYVLYRYQRHQDVRLVFAPEVSIAFFGGDPDNFEFPRYDLDVTFLRVYEGGKPWKPAHYLTWSEQGAAEGELVFVSGHPGRTARLKTMDELTYQRDTALPEKLFWFTGAHGWLEQFAVRGAEQDRISRTWRFGIGNAIKAYRGMRRALADRGFYGGLVEREQALRQAVAAEPKLQGQYGDAWERVSKAVARMGDLRVRYAMLETYQGFWSKLFGHGRSLVRAAAERAKPNAERLEEYADARLPELTQALFSPAPLYPEMEIETLTFGLTRLVEELGPDDALVRRVMGAESPRALATRVVTGTKLGDAAVRKALYEGGRAAVDASDDPMVALARAVDPEARAIREQVEDEIEATLEKGTEAIARARFAVHGRNAYPDATFTLRLSFGRVQGWQEGDRVVPAFTTMAGAYGRHTGSDPFALPATWLKARDEVRLDTRLNLATTNDIIGGNSGSPMVNAKGEVVGLIFDGNRHSLGGDYGFDPRLNRAVAVHSEGIVEALRTIYGATRVLAEIGRAR